MDRFEMQKYYKQYIAAESDLRRAVDHLNDMKHPVIFPDGTVLVADQEDIVAAEAKVAELRKKADDLYCLGCYGKTRTELGQAQTYRPVGIQSSGHWPGQR